MPLKHYANSVSHLPEENTVHKLFFYIGGKSKKCSDTFAGVNLSCRKKNPSRELVPQLKGAIHAYDNGKVFKIKSVLVLSVCSLWVFNIVFRNKE
jgi:hypothetical protein